MATKIKPSLVEALASFNTEQRITQAMESQPDHDWQKLAVQKNRLAVATARLGRAEREAQSISGKFHPPRGHIQNGPASYHSMRDPISETHSADRNEAINMMKHNQALRAKDNLENARLSTDVWKRKD